MQSGESVATDAASCNGKQQRLREGFMQRLDFLWLLGCLLASFPKLFMYSRLPHLVEFSNLMVKQFTATFSPRPLVYITGFGIAIGEAGIGTLLIFGLLLRPTLVIGTLLMLLLIFGSTLIQEYQALSTQMVAVAFYIGLLATVRHDRCADSADSAAAIHDRRDDS